MIAVRLRLPNRRPTETFEVECNGLHYVVSVGRFADGSPAEIFVSNGKAGSDSDANARDAAIITNIALQYGVPLEVIRHALLRDPRGKASTPIGAALDEIAGQSS
jgi:hypothetical protein